MPSLGLEEKFRSKGLDPEDEPILRNEIIKNNDNPSKLLSFVYIYGYSFAENSDILDICGFYIRHPIPGLTAICMRVAIDYWRKEKYFSSLEKYLDRDLLDSEWYDEVIFTIGFISRNSELFDPSIINRFSVLMSDKRVKSLGIL